MIHGVLAANINYEILADDGKGLYFDIFNDIIGLLVNKIAALSKIFNISRVVVIFKRNIFINNGLKNQLFFIYSKSLYHIFPQDIPTSV